MKKAFILFLLISISTIQFVKGQGRVSVIFIDNENKETENATAELLRSKDSSVVRTALTDKFGSAEFENVTNGNYLVRGNLMNHQPSYSSLFSIEAGQQLKLPVMILIKKDAKELSAVNVIAKKPFIQRLNDRIVVNVENSIVNAGSTALEVLERSPGITINSSDIISVKGKAGVIVLIDGKASAMSGVELVTYLRSLPSSLIQQIDIITNPSAKYDAAGSAGIIDIRLKKNQRLGTNGTITGGYGQGIYPKANGGISFNNRNKKTNFYGNSNFNFISWMNNLVVRRDFYETINYTGSYDQDNFIRRRYRTPSGRLGFDYNIDKKSVLGVIVSTSMNFTGRTSRSKSIVLDKNATPISSFTTNGNGRENTRNFVTNINFKHSFDSTGKELSVDADYARFIQDWGSDFYSNYFDKNGVPTQLPYLLSHDQDGNLQIKSAKVDYIQPIKKTGSIETGIKTSFVNADNSVLFFDKSNGAPVLDSLKSNHFLYNENIHAFYFNWKKKMKKIELQFGLRGEATSLKTKQLFFDITYDTSYFQLFPAAFVSYKLTEDKSFSISMSRRIDRPTYGQLNPFRNFVDLSLYVSGDPNLKPQTTWVYEFNYTVKQLNIGFNYSRIKDPITSVLMPTANRVTLQTAVNFSNENYFGLTVATPLKITKWWNAVNNVNLFYNTIKGFIAATTVNASYFNAIVSTNNSFTMRQNWGAEVNFSFNTGNKNGVMVDKPYYALSAGMQKFIWKNKATIRFNITDILWRSWPRFSSKYTTYREKLSSIRDTRVANLNFTYRFGNNKVQAARRRTTASEEERRRAGGN